MIIHPAEISTKGQYSTVRMQVSSSTKMGTLPEELIVTVKTSLLHEESCWEEGALIVLLPVAMFFGEDLQVEAVVSEELLYTLEEYKRVLIFWRPEWFANSIITTSAQKKDKPVVPDNRGVMCSFSGGADSMYTLQQHLPVAQKEQLVKQVTYCLHLEHWDGPQLDAATNDTKVTHFDSMLKALDVTLVSVKTNVKEFHNFNNDLAMAMTYSAAIVGVASCFSPFIKEFLFSADNTHDFGFYSTINHTVVPLFSHSSFRTIVHGPSVRKIDKLKSLSDWQPSHAHLLVCFAKPNGMKNCGTCIKCCHTMTALDMLGTLDRYQTFPHKVDRVAVRTRNHTPPFFYFPRTWRNFAKEYKRWDYYFDFTYALARCRVRQLWVNPNVPFFYKLFNPLTTLYAWSARLKKHSFIYAGLVSKYHQIFKV